MTNREKIRGVWEEVLENKEFDDEDNIMDIGGTSLCIYKISRILQERYALEISPMDILMFPSVLAMNSFFEEDKRNQEAKIETIRPIRRSVRRK
ncbi:beta-ketoacyl synthase [Clostridium sp. CAG:411]|jgi:acyl carrier protein|nr:acyl carrier protein [Lachnospiraceae bacterium]CDE45916.1 beta-ketoacyl synthase [Clostridium sp. CAG:411]